MSGKYERKREKNQKPLWLILAVAVLLLLAVVLTAIILTERAQEAGESSDPTEFHQTSETEEEESTEETVTQEQYLLSIDENIKILEIGSYSGPYVEDASDDAVDAIVQITVKNIGNKPLQYCKIRLIGNNEEEAVFEMTTLLPGDTMLVLEANRKTYDENVEYFSVQEDHIAYFQYEPDLQEDKLQIQPLDGGFNIKNISGKDIDGNIVIYFKEYSEGKYIGGITYSGTINGGLKAGEIRQIMSRNFTADSTKIVFINII